MKVLDIFTTANSNLRRSKLRTFLTGSAILIGAITLMLTTAVGYGLRSYVNDQVSAVGAKDALLITAKSKGGNILGDDAVRKYDPNKSASTLGGILQMTPLAQTDLDKIKNTAGITKVTPLYLTPLEYIGKGNNKYVSSINQSMDGFTLPIAAGRNVDASSKSYEVTIIPELVSALGFDSPEQAVGSKVDLAFKDTAGKIFTLPATIVGVQEKTIIQGNSMSMSTSLARSAFMRSTEGVPDSQRYNFMSAVAQFDYPMDAKDLQNLKSQLAKDGFEAKTIEDQLGIINSIISGIIAFLNIFAGIALAAASFGIINTLLMAVQERTREIGLMKALGLSRGKIFLLFSTEAILIGFWSSLLALGLANILARIGNNIASRTILKDFEGLHLFSLPALPMIGIVALILIIAFLAATMPARKASKLNAIDALRYE